MLCHFHMRNVVKVILIWFSCGKSCVYWKQTPFFSIWFSRRNGVNRRSLCYMKFLPLDQLFFTLNSHFIYFSYLLPDPSKRTKQKTQVKKKTLNPEFNEVNDTCLAVETRWHSIIVNGRYGPWDFEIDPPRRS